MKMHIIKAGALALLLSLEMGCSTMTPPNPLRAIRPIADLKALGTLTDGSIVLYAAEALDSFEGSDTANTIIALSGAATMAGLGTAAVVSPGSATGLLLGVNGILMALNIWQPVEIEGPALGIYQMEPATHDDIHENFIRFDDGLRGKIKDYNLMAMPIDAAHEMIGNLYYATAMCRIHYLRVPEPIPDYLGGQAQYWKTHYNSEKGAGTVQQYMNNWNRYVTPGVV
jgi:hypothetical protein